MELTRRSLLQSSTVALSLGIGGCTTAPVPGTNSSTTRKATTSSFTSEQAQTSTESPSQLPSLRFTADVLQQESTESPARVTASLTNVGSRTVNVGFGPALLFTDNVASDNIVWADDLVLIADTPTGTLGIPQEPSDGCWRFPEDGTISIMSSLDFRELSSGESLTEKYSIYTDSHVSGCLPEGTYRFQDKAEIQSDSHGMVLTLVLNIDEDGTVSAETETPVFRPE